MEQNNYQVPVMETPAAETPVAAPVYAPAPTEATLRQAIDSYVEPAFGKALAATIMAWFPITSIIAIVLGCQALSNVNKARDIATPYGMFGGGKYMASRVMATVGKYGGIAMTAFWGLYFFLFFIVFGLIFSNIAV